MKHRNRVGVARNEQCSDLWKGPNVLVWREMSNVLIFEKGLCARLELESGTYLTWLNKQWSVSF